MLASHVELSQVSRGLSRRRQSVSPYRDGQPSRHVAIPLHNSSRCVASSLRRLLPDVAAALHQSLWRSVRHGRISAMFFSFLGFRMLLDPSGKDRLIKLKEAKEETALKKLVWNQKTIMHCVVGRSVVSGGRPTVRLLA